jgi:hypothetical protein
MQWSGVGACLFVKNLAGWAFFDCLNTIFENREKKVDDRLNLLSCSHPEKGDHHMLQGDSH